MRFWDSSAVVPLLVREDRTVACLDLLKGSPENIVVWWGTTTDCVSALSRRERDGAIDSAGVTAAIGRLQQLQGVWTEVEPVDKVRRIAQRLLRVHPLRAADSLQLAAAWVLSADDPSTVELITLDVRLVEAGAKEGFSVVEPGPHLAD
jgi:predicted nucleic acid-binding protein